MPTTGTPIVPDPYASLSLPTQPGTSLTASDTTISGTTNLKPGYYPNGVNFNGGSYTVTLDPGVYYFAGGFNVNTNVTISGTGGVTIFLPSGASVNMNSAANMQLVAPTAAQAVADGCASCAGMVFWDEGGNLTLDSASNSSWGGTVYLPNGSLTWNSSSNAGAYGSIFANSIMMNATVTLSCPGGTPNGSPSISLAE